MSFTFNVSFNKYNSFNSANVNFTSLSTSKESNKIINVWTDTDYAGCPITRKSTSGGVCMLNGHLIKSWCSSQNIVALSSGEAEYYGLVRGAAHGIGLRSLLEDLGIQRRVKIKTDASVAKSIASRRGVGKIRHIEVNQLWLQEKVRNKDIELRKVKGLDNLADALTRNVDGDDIDKHLKGTRARIAAGRHEAMPDLDALTS